MPPASARAAELLPDRIAKAALALVAERGTHRIAAADVARAAGITPAAMTRYCPTEDDLWRTTADFVERRMAASWGAILSNAESPVERLRSLLAVQIGLIMDMPALREMLLSGGMQGSNVALRRGLGRVRGRFRTLLTEILREAVRAGQLLPRLDPEQTARRITETLQGMVVSWSLEAGPDDMAEEALVRLDALVALSWQQAIAAARAGTRSKPKGS